ncbi:MAG: hypothetical protein ACI388_03280 [Methanobrevibacter sp.]|uniref:hypothetical protein n=1 Tax=Methanobrevibacter sp. TaxID=66852 RepID=UPI003F125CD5
MLFVVVAFNPINAADYEGYTTDVNGFTFNMINGYEPDYETALDEDDTNIYGEQVHLYMISYYGDDGVITISTMTRYSEPFTEEDALSAGSNTQDMTSTVQNISGKTGKLVEDRSLGDATYSFWYVEDGVEITISTDSVDKIKYCLGDTD